VLNTQPISTILPAYNRAAWLSLPKATRSAQPGDSGATLSALPNARGQYLHFHPFDEAYLNRLRSGDFRTQDHFSAYFTALIKIKLGRPPEDARRH